MEKGDLLVLWLPSRITKNPLCREITSSRDATVFYPGPIGICAYKTQIGLWWVKVTNEWMEDQRTKNHRCDCLWNVSPRIKGDKSQWSYPSFPQGRHLLCRISVKFPCSCVLELISSSLSISQEGAHHLGMQQVLMERLWNWRALHSQAVRLLPTCKKPTASEVLEQAHTCSQELIVRISSQPAFRDLTELAWNQPWWEYLLHGNWPCSKSECFLSPPDCPSSNIYQYTRCSQPF